MKKDQTAIKVDIGDICVLIRSPDREIIDYTRDTYRNFLSDKDPDFEIEMADQEEVDPAEYLGVPRDELEFIDLVSENWKEETGDQKAYLDRYRTASGDVVDFTANSKPKITCLSDRTLVQRSDFAGYVDLGSQRGRNVFRKNEKITAIDSFMRICYSFIAVDKGGLLLHSAGVLRDGKGYIFFGVSGTGKSTIARLSADKGSVLSDELVVIRKKGDGYQVYGSPFYGTNEDTGINFGSDLKAAFLPLKDQEVYLKEASLAQALSKLLASVLFFGKESSLNKRMFDTCADLVTKIPFYEMHFRLDDSFWQCIDELHSS